MHGAAELRENGATLEAVAQELGVSVERARQIELAALRKCRRWCERHGFRVEDLTAEAHGGQGIGQGGLTGAREEGED